MKKIIMLIVLAFMLGSCSENYSNGERIGFITKFSKSGLIFKTWDGDLNVTQTGMNTSDKFEFSIDRDNENKELIAKIDSSALKGWKVKLTYHEVAGWNWFGNRGKTDYFIQSVEILDKNPMGMFNSNTQNSQTNNANGKVIDTIYVIIVDKNKIKQ